MRGQRAPSLQIFLLDKQDLESIFTPWKLPVIPQGAGGTHAAGSGCCAVPQTVGPSAHPLLGAAHWQGPLHTGKVLPRREMCWHCSTRGNDVGMCSNIWEKGPVLLMGSERVLLKKKEKGDGGKARLDLFSLWRSCLPCLQTKANILKQEWLKSKAVQWLLQAAYLLFSHMKRIDPVLDGMCQNELCLEGTSEAAQKCWPDKNNTKIGILFFQSVFKEF